MDKATKWRRRRRRIWVPTKGAQLDKGVDCQSGFRLAARRRLALNGWRGTHFTRHQTTLELSFAVSKLKSQPRFVGPSASRVPSRLRARRGNSELCGAQ
ncbi:hypothetical protein VNO78_15823 [Psophocarpus tetragonolobus]|uniref:Uncharacterized protein n=1 Tax=Psophocarpus tetragonolobus TaxID=3891 RepID=A0AAN9SFP2_PSOTE